ncbi:MAG: hypothetical protein OIN66_17350 [Candidatus Methanoperedens sp.]|nr:hypothetical protein [Candidatus Methanoperedens sp.]
MRLGEEMFEYSGNDSRAMRKIVYDWRWDCYTFYHATGYNPPPIDINFGEVKLWKKI